MIFTCYPIIIMTIVTITNAGSTIIRFEFKLSISGYIRYIEGAIINLCSRTSRLFSHSSSACTPTCKRRACRRSTGDIEGSRQILRIVGHNANSRAVTIGTNGNGVCGRTATVCTRTIRNCPTCKSITRACRSSCNVPRGDITYRCCRTGNSRCSITRINSVIGTRCAQRGHILRRRGGEGHTACRANRYRLVFRSCGECGQRSTTGQCPSVPCVASCYSRRNSNIITGTNIVIRTCYG